MNIDKFKAQHVVILKGIAKLREAAHLGIEANAETIASSIVKLSGVVKLHLKIEDSILYPELAGSIDHRLAHLGDKYQREMDDIARDYFDFASRWNLPARVKANPECFREEANRVLRILFERMKQEDNEFYPAIEAAHSAK